MRSLVLLAAVASLAIASAAGASRGDTVTLVAETQDWHIEVPAAIASQSDVDLFARGVQICTNEVRTLIHHRPQNVAKFTLRWVIDGTRGSFAYPTGVVSHAPDASYRLFAPGVREMWEQRVSQNLCLGPHEITHVLTWESWAMSWPNEGLATFTDWLYNGAWRYGQEPRLSLECDATGYIDANRHYPYTNLRNWSPSHESYETAACLWREVYRVGGFPAIRRILMRLRTYRPATVGDLVVNQVNPAVGTDFRPIAKRFGFTDADLVASGPVPPDPAPPSLDLGRPRATPAPPRAGRTLRTSVTVARSDTGDPVDSAAVSCPGRLGTKALAGVAKPFAQGRATCEWRLPRSTRGKTLRASTVVVFLGVSAQTSYSARVR